MALKNRVVEKHNRMLRLQEAELSVEFFTKAKGIHEFQMHGFRSTCTMISVSDEDELKRSKHGSGHAESLKLKRDGMYLLVFQHFCFEHR